MLKKETPCDWGECPYDAAYSRDCEYWCGEDEPEDYSWIDEIELGGLDED